MASMIKKPQGGTVTHMGPGSGNAPPGAGSGPRRILVRPSTANNRPMPTVRDIGRMIGSTKMANSPAQPQGQPTQRELQLQAQMQQGRSGASNQVGQLSGRPPQIQSAPQGSDPRLETRSQRMQAEINRAASQRQGPRPMPDSSNPTVSREPTFDSFGNITGYKPPRPVGSMSGPLGAAGPGPTTGPQPIGPSLLNAGQRAQMLSRPMPGPASTSSVNTTTDRDMLGGRRNMGGNPLAGGMGGLAAAMGRPAAPVKKKAGGVIAKPKAAPVKAKAKSMPAFKKGGVVKKGKK